MALSEPPKLEKPMPIILSRTSARSRHAVSDGQQGLKNPIDTDKAP